MWICLFVKLCINNKMFEYSFEKLEVWKESVDLVKSIYKITDKFPGEERFGLVSQLCRASISMSSNLSEGTSRTTNKRINGYQ